MEKIKGKTAIITGASSGIGKSLALVLAARGANIILAARKAETLQKVAQSCQEMNARAIPVQADVTKEADCKKLIDAALENFSGIDILINNAGISMRSLFINTEVDVLKKLMDVNFWGTVYCTKWALPHLLKSKGSLVGISSIAGYVGLPGRTGYSASKFAMNGFLECIRSEHYPDELHVLTVAPGFTASSIRDNALKGDGSVQGQSPLEEGKLMQPEEVAAAIIKAIEKRKNNLVLTGQGKITVLAKKLFPGWLTKKTYEHMRDEPDSLFK